MCTNWPLRQRLQRISITTGFLGEPTPVARRFQSQCLKNSCSKALRVKMDCRLYRRFNWRMRGQIGSPKGSFQSTTTLNTYSRPLTEPDALSSLESTAILNRISFLPSTLSTQNKTSRLSSIRATVALSSQLKVYGKSINNPKYFWDVVMGEYPELAHALRRIKVYRHHRVHVKLKGMAVEELSFFLTRDLNGRQPSTEPELWFLLQQCVLDDLLVGILIEIDRLT